jgi:hypothetical protein
MGGVTGDWCHLTEAGLLGGDQEPGWHHDAGMLSGKTPEGTCDAPVLPEETLPAARLLPGRRVAQTVDSVGLGRWPDEPFARCAMRTGVLRSRMEARASRMESNLARFMKQLNVSE